MECLIDHHWNSHIACLRVPSANVQGQQPGWGLFDPKAYAQPWQVGNLRPTVCCAPRWHFIVDPCMHEGAWASCPA